MRSAAAVMGLSLRVLRRQPVLVGSYAAGLFILVLSGLLGNDPAAPAGLRIRGLYDHTGTVAGLFIGGSGLLVGLSLIRPDLSGGFAEIIFTKPSSRGWYLLGKVAALLAVTLMATALVLVVRLVLAHLMGGESISGWVLSASIATGANAFLVGLIAMSFSGFTPLPGAAAATVLIVLLSLGSQLQMPWIQAGLDKGAEFPISVLYDVTPRLLVTPHDIPVGEPWVPSASAPLARNAVTESNGETTYLIQGHRVIASSQFIDLVAFTLYLLAVSGLLAATIFRFSGQRID